MHGGNRQTRQCIIIHQKYRRPSGGAPICEFHRPRPPPLPSQRLPPPFCEAFRCRPFRPIAIGKWWYRLAALRVLATSPNAERELLLL
jgi:hypothetical protein